MLVEDLVKALLEVDQKKHVELQVELSVTGKGDVEIFEHEFVDFVILSQAAFYEKDLKK